MYFKLNDTMSIIHKIVLTEKYLSVKNIYSNKECVSLPLSHVFFKYLPISFL